MGYRISFRAGATCCLTPSAAPVPPRLQDYTVGSARTLSPLRTRGADRWREPQACSQGEARTF